MKWLLSGVLLVTACGGGGSARGAARGGETTPATATRAATAADVHFMAGMLAHHRQALVMADWALDPARGASPPVRVMSERIKVSQSDEIATIEQWLAQRGMAPMQHHGALMPGMLTADQLAQLERARGAEFDRLFLTLMIQHHRGAITMVDALLRFPGAAQDPFVFQFAADVHADQTAEIERMQRLLETLPSGG